MVHEIQLGLGNMAHPTQPCIQYVYPTQVVGNAEPSVTPNTRPTANPNRFAFITNNTAAEEMALNEGSSISRRDCSLGFWTGENPIGLCLSIDCGIFKPYIVKVKIF